MIRPREKEEKMKKLIWSIGLMAVLAVSTGCTTMQGQATSQTKAMIVAGVTNDWPTFNGSYAGDRYSRLDEVTSQNVSSLRKTCTFDTGEMGAFQNGPVVVNGVIFITTDVNTYAIDGATCEQKWKHIHDYSPRSWLGVNRGAAYLDGRLFRGTGDGHVYAIDAATGRTVWDVSIADPKRGESIPLAPIAWNGMVFVGNAGGDMFGVTGRVYALSVEDGHTIWQFNTVPDTGPARATWTKASSENPPTGGATWTSYTLDTQNGILYVPTGNVAPDFVAALHPGKSLYTTCVLALNARTGRIAGYVQPVQDDQHDHDVAAATALIVTRAGQQLALAAAKNGLLYGIDRSAVRLNAAVDARENLAPQSLVIRYQAATTTRENLDTPLSPDRSIRFCPGSQGGSEWNGPAYHPSLNLVFVPANDWCTSVQLANPDTLRGQPGMAWSGSADPEAAFGKMDPKEKWGGWLTAFDAESGAERWKYHSSAPLLAAVTPTAGGLVFTGDLLGDVLAFDAASGKIMWREHVGNPMAAGVVSYVALGHQRIAVASGTLSPLWPVASGTSRIIIFSLP
jgi:alcohol dehydrogenase (cytochrome c)